MIEKSFATLDDVNAIILVADSDGRIVFANKAVKSILGYEPEEVLGDGWWILTTNDTESELRKSITGDIAKGLIGLGNRHLYQNVLPTRDGRKVWAQWTNTRTADGYLVGIAQDVTEKKALEEELIRKNQESELLLKEIHHRVKNNLQIISSLLNLQLNGINDHRVHNALSKSKDRINSMALIHTKLYQSRNLATINFGEYVNELVGSIEESYAQFGNIQCEVRHDAAVFDIDLSINLGLIITELISNSYKHAFIDRMDGLITVDLTQKGEGYQLVIADNGVGMKSEQNSPESIGLEIVKGLVEQINATIDVRSEAGVRYEICFRI